MARVIDVESSRCISLIRLSLTMTAVAAAASWAARAAIAARIAASTSEPIRRTWSLTAPSSTSSAGRDGWAVGFAAMTSSSSSSASRMISLIWRVTASVVGRSFGVAIAVIPLSAEPTGHAVLGQLVLRVGEDVRRPAHLDEVAGAVVAHREERGGVADAGRLLHVVSHDDDRVVLAELAHQLLAPEGRDRVERRRRLVHQDHLGVDRERAGDAQPLLLPAGERHPVRLELVLDLVPERRPAEAPLGDLVEVGLGAAARELQ